MNDTVITINNKSYTVPAHLAAQAETIREIAVTGNWEPGSVIASMSAAHEQGAQQGREKARAETIAQAELAIETSRRTKQPPGECMRRAMKLPAALLGAPGPAITPMLPIQVPPSTTANLRQQVVARMGPERFTTPNGRTYLVWPE